MEKEKVAQLFSSKEFLKELLKKKSEKEIQELFIQHDIELTPEEIEELCDVVEACTTGFVILPDSSLEDIVGGVQKTEIMNIFRDNYDVINQVIKENQELISGGNLQKK